MEFTVKPHPLFKRDGKDIYLNVPITITEAVLGCKKEIPSLNGVIKLIVPSGTKTGDKERFKDKGIEDLNSYRKGDMYVIYQVIIPDKLTRDQKKLFEALSATNLDDNKDIKNFNNYVKQCKN